MDTVVQVVEREEADVSQLLQQNTKLSKFFNLLRPFIFNLLVYETGERIFSKSGKKIKNQIAGFYFCRWSKNHEYEK